MRTERTEHVDVVVVGAGISGIGAGYHLQTMCPNRTYVVLEGRDDLGGTWDLFRYPGVRSDSDMHTLGYRFKPWTAAKSIADGPSILAYLRETVAQFGIDRHIRFRHLVRSAEWSSEDAAWTVHAERTSSDGVTEPVTITCNYLFMCSGYYSYTEPYDAQIPDLERFAGPVVHPQFWPGDLDYTGRRVVVIGSGATAMTIVPAMAATAGHVTMLQRSPTYVVSRPSEDVIANTLRRWLPDKLAYDLTRRKNVALMQFFYSRSRTQPEKVKRQLLRLVRKAMPDVDVDTHFTPRYNPWDQRLCLIPDQDLYRAINAGKVDVVTDTIDTVTETGIKLDSGNELEVDVIVTATGLQLVTLGEVEFVVDGEPVDFAQTWTYKGFAYSDVPNLASSFGYINASWTLRADLTCEYVCRLLNHMEATGTQQCTPRLRPEDAGMARRDWIEGFSSGYIQRVVQLMPKQGDRESWINPQRYKRDKQLFRKGDVADGVMQFTDPRPAPVGAAAAVAR
jgi:cation diffusion facilitator CzcD-associated flavoprotein CzcO